MHRDFDFYRTTMPATRSAHYYLSCLNSSVFIDFDRLADDRITLIRISFDGFGCCHLDQPTTPLSSKDSQEFIQEIEKEELNQEAITRLVKQAIRLNQRLIWSDALEKYQLID